MNKPKKNKSKEVVIPAPKIVKPKTVDYSQGGGLIPKRMLKREKVKPNTKLVTLLKGVKKVRGRINNIIIGSKATGKTVLVKELVKKYIKKYPKEKVIILDRFNVYTKDYNGYKEISLEQIKTFRKPSRINMAKYGFNEVIRAIIDNFKGLVIIEDYSDFMDDCKGCYIN